MDNIKNVTSDNKINLLSEKIIDLFSPKKLLAILIRNFYESIILRPTYTEEEVKLYFNIARTAFDFLENKNDHKPKVRIFNPNIAEYGFELDYTIIEILAESQPFMIDSISEELIADGFNIYRIIHSIIYVKRDEKGHLQDISLESRPLYSQEALLHFHISAIPDIEIVKPCEQNLLRIIHYIKLAVSDEEKMLAQQSNYIEGAKFPQNEIKVEINDFIQWSKENFILLGACNLEIKDDKFISSDKLGILSIEQNQNLLSELTDLSLKDDLEITNIEHYITIGRLSIKSLVHVRKNLSYIYFKEYDINGNLASIKLFVGIFTSGILYQNVQRIPLIRRKIEYVLGRANFALESSKRGEFKKVLEDLPREELFYINKDNLLNLTIQILGFIFEPKVKLCTFEDSSGHFINNLIFIPQEIFTADLAEKLNDFLKSVFGGVVEKSYHQLNNSYLKYFHIVLYTEDKHDKTTLNIEKVEKKLRLLTHRWLDDLYIALIHKHGNIKGRELYNKYKDAFPAAYRDRFTVDPSALKDLSFIEKAAIDEGTVFDLYKLKEDPEDIFRLKIYTNDKKIALYKIMPIIENLGFRALESYTYRITPSLTQALWVNDFYLSVSTSQIPKITDIKLNVQEALHRIYTGFMHDDGFNKLMITAAFNWQQVRMVRALIKYMKQVGLSYSQELIENCINSHTEVVTLIYQLYDTLFNPFNRDNVERKSQLLQGEIEGKLNSIASDVEDRILRDLYNTVRAILRTNHYQTINGKPKDYISFKFDSSRVPNLPEPKPFREIFFHSKKAKGIHLRGGSVARGGLRWSDRAEDFRTEILGLMKAQNTKNTVIVPVGSKGGFVLTNASNLLPNQLLEEAKECYQNYLRGLLDITDNIIDGRIVSPQDVIKLDNDDPYLVVAADKGTATFSDLANSVSKEYNFWLGDAFASGGSAGYDHKKIGITAKGGWISVCRHFHEISISIQEQYFTVVGIGDMSGDVFGNGMLLSDHIKLIAAFNHMHIFIDPNPDPEKSFAERLRLFTLSRSTWNDYDKALISMGGGVFERKAKYIDLSEEIRELFEIEETKLHPNELIKRILKSNYDLLWNGGIGTYIKSSTETNSDVGDKSNDSVRVDGNELRCKVIGEGGNLGCTQLGRIEYALNGGKLNTDFIDNSAGVDCSDHEVNIKIVFQKALESNKISLEERNKILAEMTEEVGKLVLEDNYQQTQAISIAISRVHSLLPLQSRLIDRLEEKGLLNRKIEFLPSKQELTRRLNDKVGLTRPELSVLLAYSKIDLYYQILNSTLPDDLYFEKYLISYFPENMRKDFMNEIKSHTLKREIIATVVTNKIINRMGMTYFNLVAEDTGLPACDIARAYIVANDTFRIDDLWRKIETLDNKVQAHVQMELFNEIIQFIQIITFWLLRNLPQPIRVNKDTNDLLSIINDIVANVENILTEDLAKTYHEKISKYTKAAVAGEVAKEIASLMVLESAFNIMLIQANTKVSPQQASIIYFLVGHRLKFNWLDKKLSEIEPSNFWERLSIKTLKEDLSDKQRNITIDIIRAFGFTTKSVDQWGKNNSKHLERYDQLLFNLVNFEHVDLSMIIVAIKRLEFLTVK